MSLNETGREDKQFSEVVRNPFDLLQNYVAINVKRMQDSVGGHVLVWSAFIFCSELYHHSSDLIHVSFHFKFVLSQNAPNIIHHCNSCVYVAVCISYRISASVIHASVHVCCHCSARL